MNSKIIVAIVATIAVSTAAAQGNANNQTYQFEATGGWRSTVTDTNPDIEINRLRFTGSYYLAPVSVKNHPWNEAAFLEHSMGVTALLGYTEFKIASFSADGPSIGAGFRYAEPDKPIAADISLSFATLSGDMNIDVDQVDFNGRVGYWLRPNAIVGAELGVSDYDAGGLLSITTTRFGGYGKIVHDLDDGRAVNVEAHAGFANVDVGVTDDTNFEFGVAGDFYFTPRYSAGALLDMSVGDAASVEGVTFGIRGSAWFTPNVAMNASYSRFTASDNSGADQDEFGIFVNVRF